MPITPLEAGRRIVSNADVRLPAALRFVLRLLIVAGLLGAQQAALAHDLWHAAKGEASAAVSKQGEGEGQKAYCDLHDVLGTVLGAVQGAAPQACAPSDTASCAADAHTSAIGVDVVQPASRGPPALS